MASPIITIEINDAASASIAETNAGLSAADTLTVRDADVADTVTASVTSVVKSGTFGAIGVSDGVLLTYLSVTAGLINADPADTNNLSWTFNSAGYAFDYLGTGQSLVLDYTVVASDGSTTGSQVVSITITGTNDTPALATPATIPYTDTSGADAFSNATGTLSATDAEGTTLSYSITGGAADGSLGGYDLSRTGTYGKLYLNSATGAYLYDPSDAAINAVSANQSESFTLVASDGSLSDSESLLISITGTNDTPALATPGGVAYTDTAAADTFSNATGTLSASDAEGTALTYSITGGAADGSLGGYDLSRTGTYGKLYLNSTTGAYLYDPNDAAINGVSANQSESFTLVASDGSLTDSELLSISITGTNDNPVLVTPTAIPYTDTAAADTFSNTTGTLSASDAEGTALTYSISGGSADASLPGYNQSRTGFYGKLYLNTATGAYLYDPTDSTINAVGPTNVSDTFTMVTSDGSLTDSETLAVNIAGANDTPIGTITITPDTLYLTQHYLQASHNITDAEGYTTATITWLRDGVTVAQSTIVPAATTTSSYLLTYPQDAGHYFTVQVTYTDGGGTNETVTSSATQLVGAWRIGTSGDDSLDGSIGNDSLEGLAGNDTLNGLAGNDTMIGGSGNDTYYVDSTSDIVTEASVAPNDDASDSVFSSIDISLTGMFAGLEHLTLTGVTAVNGTGNADANRITGNAINNSLVGGAGHDTIDGGAGSDTMVGGTGNDWYYVDSATDVITETSTTDTRDQVFSSVDYTLSGGAAFIEYLTLTGVTAVNGVGNGLNNQIVGNSINNVLAGAAGNDTIDGGAGDDTLDGGLGNDTYVVDSANDVILADTGGVLDQVVASVSYSIGSTTGIERLTLMGLTDINGTGNALNNLLTGNNGSNSLAGGLGNDTLYGLNGNDTLAGDGGTDSMVGGGGDDVYYVTDTTDKVVEASGLGTDTIYTTVTYTMPVYVEAMILLAGAANGTGSAQNDTITGNTSANQLKGMAGNDSLYGGDGADTLTGGPGADYLDGQVGADQYVYALVTESPNLVGQRDTINLSLADGDKIVLTAIDANVLLAGDQAFTWKGIVPFTSPATGQLYYDSAAGIVYGSNDADLDAEFAIIVGTGLSESALNAAIMK